MAINKSQGHTLGTVGIYLPQSYFAYHQLYPCSSLHMIYIFLLQRRNPISLQTFITKWLLILSTLNYFLRIKAIFTAGQPIVLFSIFNKFRKYIINIYIYMMCVFVCLYYVCMCIFECVCMWVCVRRYQYIYMFMSVKKNILTISNSVIFSSCLSSLW